MSEEDISVGTNWSERIKHELGNTSVGIICVTPENQDAKWINFEMGALSKAVDGDNTRVIPMLIGFDDKGQLGQPASSFNMTLLDNQGLHSIAKSLNEVINQEFRREHGALTSVVEVWWNQLSTSFTDAMLIPPDAVTAVQDEPAMIREILETVRDMQRHSSGYNAISGAFGLSSTRSSTKNDFALTGGMSKEDAVSIVTRYMARNVVDIESTIHQAGDGTIILTTSKPLTTRIQDGLTDFACGVADELLTFAFQVDPNIGDIGS